MTAITACLRVTLIALATGVSAAPAAAQDPSPAEVFVVSTLYRRHAEVPAYGHDSLRAIIERIRPTAVVLDVSPRELRDQAVHPSKAEYPQVIFPYVRQHRLRAYAGEPDEPVFSEVVQQLGRRLSAFRTEDPAAAQADAEHERATWAALARAWQSPADVNGALTDQLLAARRAYQDRVAGPGVAGAWGTWNDHAVAMVRRAAVENPGGRVLVLIGVENAALIRPALGQYPELALVDVERWLRTGTPPEPVADVAAATAALLAFDAAWSRGDTLEAARWLAPGYRYFTSTGSVWNRDRLLGLLGSPDYHLESSDRSEIAVRVVGSTALVASRWRGTGRYGAQAIADDQRCSLVLVGTAEGWRILAEHCTQLAPG